MERSCGTFQRALRLPGPVDPEQVQANFENGALTVTVPKTEQQDGIQIGGSEGAKTNAESGSRAKSSSRS